MKITNPKVFTCIDNLPAAESQIMVRGDVKCMFAKTADSQWHFTKENEDEYVRYSFDGGSTWPLEFKFRNTLVDEHSQSIIDAGTGSSTAEITPAEAERLQRGHEFVFDFSGTTPEQWNAVTNATPLFFSVNAANDVTSIASYRVQYDATEKKVKMIILENLPSDTTSVKMKLLLNGSEALVLTTNQGTWTEETPNP